MRVVGRVDGEALSVTLRQHAGGRGIGLARHLGRVRHGACAVRRAVIRERSSAYGRCVGNDSLIDRFNSSTRNPIFTNTQRIVSKVAPRHCDFFGAASRTECNSQ